jgi:hypothetical protein
MDSESCMSRCLYCAVVLVLGSCLFFGSCKAREPPVAEGKPDSGYLKAPIPVAPICRDNDADCPPGSFCNRTDCSDVFNGPSKVLHPCENDAACIGPRGDKLLCLQGRCRMCLNAEECAPGGERAGWYCNTGYCSTKKETRRDPLPPPYGPKYIPFPSTDNLPAPVAPPPDATAPTLPTPPLP